MGKEELNQTDSIIFDLDGTLWDASPACVLAWHKALKEFELETDLINEDMVRSVSGLRIEKILDQYFGFVPKEKLPALLDIYKVHEIELVGTLGGKLFPGVKDALSVLRKKYKLFIVSNCLVGYIENFIAFHGLENTFIDFESSGRTGMSKAENIRSIIERNRLKNPVYVGDTIWDKDAAEENDLRFIYAAYGFGKVENAGWQIESVGELEGLL